jgi:hypothetical protein
MAMMQPQPGPRSGMQNMPEMQQGAPTSPMAPSPPPETPRLN